MALDDIQQIKQLLSEKKQILITFRKNANGDATASAIALFLFLKKMGKQTDIVCENFSVPQGIKFLKHADEIKPGFEYLQKFILAIDIKETGLKELSYDVKDEKLRIYITPKNGFLNREDVKTAQSDFKYEVIFVLDSPDLESLGNLYDSNTDLFYKKPIINIDSSTANENFGQINIIDLQTSSTAEVVYNLISKIAPELIDEDIATAILTGMIAKTKSFKSPDVKPETLSTASKLMSLGAKRDYIVQNLYRTKSISTLKLWGQALSHLQHDPTIGLVWTTITHDDFGRSGTTENDLKDIISELISSSPEAKMILLLNESSIADDKNIHGIFTCEKVGDALTLMKPFGATGNKRQINLKIENKTLNQAEMEIIEYIKKITV